MGTSALPDMYALSPRASGIHIRQSTRAHVITYTYICLQRMWMIPRSPQSSPYLNALLNSVYFAD